MAMPMTAAKRKSAASRKAAPAEKALKRPTLKQILASPRSRYIDVRAAEWRQSAFPGVEIKVLYEDKKTGMLTALTRMAPGSCIPLHIHPSVEQTYVLEGSLEDEQGAATAGNFVWRPAGNMHLAHAPNGCLALSFFIKPNRFFDEAAGLPDRDKPKKK